MKKQLSRLLAVLCLLATLATAIALTASAADAPYLDYDMARTPNNGNMGYANPDDGMKYYATFAGMYGYMYDGFAAVSGATTGAELQTVISSGDFRANNFQLQLGDNVNKTKTIDYLSNGIQLDFDYYYGESSSNKALQIRTYKTVGDKKSRYDVIQLVGGQLKKSTKYFVAAEEGSSETVALDGYGWHHITMYLRQTATQQDGAWVYSVRVDIYVNGKLAMSLVPTADYLAGSCFYEVDANGAISSYANYYIQAYQGDFYSTTTGLSSSKHTVNRMRNPIVKLGQPLDLGGIKSVSYQLNGGEVIKTGTISIDEQFIVTTGKHGYVFVPYVDADGTFKYEAYDNKYNKYYTPGQTLLLPEAKKDGANFLGWGLVDGDASSIVDAEATASLTGDVKLYAIWETLEGDYTVTISCKGEVLSTSKPVGNTVTLPNDSAYWLVGNEVKAAGETVTLTADTVIPAFEIDLLDGASARASEVSGLRFETKIDLVLLEALYTQKSASGADVKIGTLILPTDLLGDTEFTAEALTAAGKTFLDLNTDHSDSSAILNDDGTVSFTAAIVNILSQNYARKFSAISYVECNGVRVYTDYDAENNSRSVYEVAVAANKAEPDASYADVIRGFIDGVIVIENGAQVQPDGYTHPYTATVADGVLTVSAASPLTESDLKTVILDGVNYTGGWTAADGLLKANLPTN